MDYTKEFEEVSKLKPVPRGTAFELLINKILRGNELALYGRFRTSNNSQEIDGAILIQNKVFLLEAKWENEDTLAASKLYSFIGKINSKLEGTLGFFISYNELKDNFVDAIRGGLRQNCILIHGPSNIMDIIKGKVDLKSYLEYCYVQASTKNIAHVSTAQFLIDGPFITTSKPTAKTSTEVNVWRQLFKELIDGTDKSIFAANLLSWDLRANGISDKILNIFSTIRFDQLTAEKFEFLLNTLLTKDKDGFTNVLVEKLKGDQWVEYSSADFTGFLTGKLTISTEDRIAIITNVSFALKGNNYDLENLASNVISIFYNQVTPDEKQLLAKIFINIYCDVYRLDKFPQKQLSNKIFKDIIDTTGKYFDVVKSFIIDDIRLFKVEEAIYADKEDTPDAMKRLTVSRVYRKYKRVFDENGFNQSDAQNFIEEEYEK